jgi:ABC-type Mn2+/Zn2+ transport system permease subunit
LTHILFGNILGVARVDVLVMLVIAVIIGIAITFFYKELLATSFDPVQATAIGLSPEIIRYGLLFLIALTVVAGIQTVGVVLVLALLVTPAAISSLLAKRLVLIIIISEAVAIFSSSTGFYASYYLDIASGATIVLVLSGLFAVAYIGSRIRIH